MLKCLIQKVVIILNGLNGDIIKRAMTEKGLSYADLSRMCGIPKATLQRHAAGKTKNIPVDAVKKIADALCVSASSLICVDDDDAEFVASLGELKPLEQLSEDARALNVLLYDLGEHIIKVDGNYYLGVCGILSEKDIAFLKSSAASGLKIAYEALKSRAESEMKDALSEKK